MDDDKKDHFAHRKAQFKKSGLTDDDARRKREDHAVRISKAKREEQAAKRRVIAEDPVDPTTNRRSHLPTVADMGRLIDMINSGDPDEQYNAVSSFRRMLSKERDPPIDAVIHADLVPVFVSFLVHPEARLQFEACWALTNIASGTRKHTMTVLHSGAIPHAVKLLDSDSENCREQAVWLLGNVIGDSPACRDAVLGADPLPGIIRHLAGDSKLSFVRNTTWTLSNFLRWKPAPSPENVILIVATLAKLIYSGDIDILTDALWGLSYLTDGDDPTTLQLAIEAGIATRLVELLGHEESAVVTPALRTLGNIVSGDELQTQVMIDAGCLHALGWILKEGRLGLKKEACWTVSNIMAGQREQVQAVLMTDIVETLINLMVEGKRDIRREACWALSNATSGGSYEQLLQLVGKGALKGIASVLSAELNAALSSATNAPADAKVLMVSLEGFENFLKAAPGMVAVAPAGTLHESFIVDACSNVLLEDVWGIWSLPDLLSMAQDMSDQDVYKKARYLMATFFPGATEGAYDAEEVGGGGAGGGDDAYASAYGGHADGGGVGDGAEWAGAEGDAYNDSLPPAPAVTGSHFAFGSNPGAAASGGSVFGGGGGGGAPGAGGGGGGISFGSGAFG